MNELDSAQQDFFSLTSPPEFAELGALDTPTATSFAFVTRNEKSDGCLLARGEFDADADEIIRGLSSSDVFDLVHNSNGAFSTVSHGPDSKDRSARTDRFEFHNDGLYLPDPPDFCILYCKEAGRGDIPTIFIDSRHVLSTLVNTGIPLDLLMSLQQSYIDRRGQQHSYNILRAHPRFPFLVLQYFSGVGPLRQHQQNNVRPLSEAELAELKTSIDASVESAPSTSHRWKSGRFAVWDNYVFLHARPNLEIDVQRVLLRVWFSRKPSHDHHIQIEKTALRDFPQPRPALIPSRPPEPTPLASFRRQCGCSGP